MVLVRSESGQLLMIHQQALAQMQAQAAQAAPPPRQAPSAAMPPAQVYTVPQPCGPVGWTMVRRSRCKRYLEGPLLCWQWMKKRNLPEFPSTEFIF